MIGIIATIGRVTRMVPSGIALVGGVAALAIVAVSDPAAAEDLSRFFGTYVGRATAENLVTGVREERDIDIVIAPFGDDGLRIDWTTVGLVDGRRDVPGVRRWAQTASFKPSPDRNFLIEAEVRNIFRERDEMEVIKGDPVRWTWIDDDTLHVCTFVVLEDGRYELQIYQRILTDIGMDILFERIVDGETVRRVSGRTARAG